MHKFIQPPSTLAHCNYCKSILITRDIVTAVAEQNTVHAWLARLLLQRSATRSAQELCEDKLAGWAGTSGTLQYITADRHITDISVSTLPLHIPHY